MLAFSSPCCLPLLPGYFGFLSGLSGEDDGKLGRRRTLIGASLFVLGFVVVFTTLGASASLLGTFLRDHRQATYQVSGLFVVAMGVSMLMGARVPFLSRGARIDFSRMRRRPAGAFPLGMAFAFGWTPCVGPVLAALLVYAGATGSLVQGASLLFVYALGLGIPFIRGGAPLSESDPVLRMAAPARPRDNPRRRSGPGRDGRAAGDGRLDGPVRAGAPLVRKTRLAADLALVPFLSFVRKAALRDLERTDGRIAAVSRMRAREANEGEGRH